MEDMAAMLNQMAGGLQQSFGTVFERVGQSLEQSAQMMQMMNAMMEAAMLQHLVTTTNVRPLDDRFVLELTVENRSQINITEIQVGVMLGDRVDSDNMRTLEQGLAAKSTAETTFPLDPATLGSEATIVLRVRSPGTYEWLEKNVLFRIPVLKMTRVEGVMAAFVMQEGMVHAQSDAISINLLREALGVSPFDPLLTASVGYYRLHVPARVFAEDPVELAVQILQATESPTGVRVVAVPPRTKDAEQAERQCQVLLTELESL